MSTLNIVLLSVAGAFAIASIVFMVMFIIEITVSSKNDSDEVEVKSIFSSENYVKTEDDDAKIDSMLAKLDEQADEQSQEIESKEEVVEESEPSVQEEVVEETKEIENEEVIEVVAEENVEKEEISGETEETIDESETIEKAEETSENESVEGENEKVEESAEVDGVKVEEVIGETISVESLPDYKARLDKIIENRDKINKDLIKVEKSILNYERTKRRKARNQKMLDRRASELTNLNLVMYSVTDIKNVDEDKKVKQEELTSHIAELKASIQDADEFLDSNKEKNEHDVKMAKFLIQEKARYNEEITELQKLISKTEGSVA